VNLDAAVLGLVVVFGVLGLISGAATQVGRAVGLAVAYAAAGPAGTFVGLPVSQWLTTSLTLGTVVGTMGSFVVIYVVVHLVSTALFRRFLTGGPEGGRGALDRLLGGLLGAFKAAAVLYIALCAATFLESNVSIAGQRLSMTPKDSVLLKLVRRYNLLELQQFGGVHELIKAVKVSHDTRLASKYKDDPDFVAIQRDPRFKALLASEPLKKALESADVRALLANNHVVELLQDSRAMERIERIADSH
jgi:membrane protein required for colicin V production